VYANDKKKNQNTPQTETDHNNVKNEMAMTGKIHKCAQNGNIEQNGLYYNRKKVTTRRTNQIEWLNQSVCVYVFNG